MNSLQEITLKLIYILAYQTQTTEQIRKSNKLLQKYLKALIFVREHRLKDVFKQTNK